VRDAGGVRDGRGLVPVQDGRWCRYGTGEGLVPVQDGAVVWAPGERGDGGPAPGSRSGMWVGVDGGGKEGSRGAASPGASHCARSGGEAAPRWWGGSPIIYYLSGRGSHRAGCKPLRAQRDRCSDKADAAHHGAERSWIVTLIW
jgi:hypothetical protein